MKINIIYTCIVCVAAFLLSSCSKDDLPIIKSPKVEVFESKPVVKSNKMKLYAHYMPWFETPETNNGNWGQHWTMANSNPNNTKDNGQKDIASNYYPHIGPYASSNENVLQYHLLLMKYSGIDGVLIDWYGTRDLYDYPLVKKNTEALIKVLDKVGLEFAIVYEDQTLRDDMEEAQRVTQAKTDMEYLEKNFFGLANYIKTEGKPLLLTFGPQVLQNADEWNDILGALTVKPALVPLYAHAAGKVNNPAGEFIWVDNTPMNVKYESKDDFSMFIGGAYPGFNDYYEQGGWGEQVLAPIDYENGNTFKRLLQMAKDNEMEYLQLITWNDFGEGTMIEPTVQFEYKFLEELQTFAGAEYTVGDLKNIYNHYLLSVEYGKKPEVSLQLEQAFYYLVSLQTEKAKQIIENLK